MITDIKTKQALLSYLEGFITEHKRSEVKLLTKTNQLRALAAHLQSVREEERLVPNKSNHEHFWHKIRFN